VWHLPTNAAMLDLIQSHLLMEQLVKTEEKKIRKALEDAKKQSALWAKHGPRPYSIQ
jgi:hypothetical protein